MNKGKAKRLRKELEREQYKADRGHQAVVTKLRKPVIVPPRPMPLTGVQTAVHAPDARPNDQA